MNRLCGSGLQAIISAAHSIPLGDAALVAAGGAESMSRGGYLLPAERWGARLGDSKVVDMVVGTLNHPFGGGHMGKTAENVAAHYDISRELQDEFSAESHRRAAVAIAAGYFEEQITPVELPSRKGITIFGMDEHVRAETSKESLAELKPAHKKDGTVTAGNASGRNDGAAALVLASGAEISRRGARPIARLVSYDHADVAPEVVGLGPTPGSQLALKKAGLTFEDLDLIESNEAFAMQACAVTLGLGLDPKRVNPNGGTVALGHPIGASGAGAALDPKLYQSIKPQMRQDAVPYLYRLPKRLFQKPSL